MNETGFAPAFIISVISAVLAENFVFARAFGVSTMIVAARNRRNLRGICIGVSYFTAVSSLLSMYVLDKMTAELSNAYLPIVYVLIIGILYALTLLGSMIFFKPFFSKLKKYVHISAFNSVVMGTIFLSISKCSDIGQHLVFGLCSGLSFALAAYMFSGVCSQLYSENTPRAFRGYPAVMIFIGIISMALYGILGHSPVYI